MSEAASRKLMELEALRGVAAVIVLFHHFLLVVAPRLHGRNFPDDPIALVRTPLFALVNGSAAVAIFFVLSGFVLTLRAMEKRDWGQLLTGVAKRWPRLVPLVAIVNILSAIFLMLGLYHDHSWFGAGIFKPGTSVIGSALIEGVFSTFFTGSTDFNAALWTMHYELFGSFAAYATALLLIFQKSFSRAMVIGTIALLLTATLTGEGGIYYAMLVAGALIARIYLERNTAASALAFMSPWRVPIVLGTVGLVVVLCGYDGYSKPVGFMPLWRPLPRQQPSRCCTASPRLPSWCWFCFAIRSAEVWPVRSPRCWDGCHFRSISCICRFCSGWFRLSMPAWRRASTTWSQRRRHSCCLSR
jgi:peptidoglycan/LPS O-acetylase OafA/YrhL